MFAPPNPASLEAEEPVRTADWVELNLLTNEEHSVSIADVTASFAEHPQDESSASEHRGDYAEDSEDLDPETLNKGYWNNAEVAAELAFNELHQRSIYLGNRYPLILDGETAAADATSDSIDVARFLTLLRSRHLYHRALEDNGTLAGQLFEELLTHALRKFLGTSRTHAVRFGVAGGTRGGGLPNNTDDALDQLAQRIKEPRGTLKGLPDGDIGADSIAWRPFPDPYRGQLTTIAQATISEREWTKKQPSPKWASGRLIRLLTRPTTVVAFVESISLTNDSVLEGIAKQFNSLPLDRFRLLCYVRDNDIPCDLQSRIETWSDEMHRRLPK